MKGSPNAMINPADWNYLLIGSGLSFATQFALVMGRETLPLVRIIVSSCIMAAIASFSVNGLLIIGFGVPPLASMFLGGIVGFAGGDFALSQMTKHLLKRYSGDDSRLEEVYQTMIDVKATMSDIPIKQESDD